MEITEKQNLDNMRKCPRFDWCDINKCPIDYWADLRTELPEEDICPMWRFVGRIRTKRMKTKITPRLRGLVSNIRELRKKERKTAL
jgi:hypothetical protein